MYKVIICYPDQLQDTLNKNKDKKLIQILPVTAKGTLFQYSIVYFVSTQTAVYEQQKDYISFEKSALENLCESAKKNTQAEVDEYELKEY